MNISLSYTDHLQAQVQRLEGKRGSENLKVLLMAAAVKTLEISGYTELKVADLCQDVGVSRATFYLHFSSIGELMAEVAKGLTELELTLMPSMAGEKRAWDALQKIIEWRVSFLAANLYITEACAALSDSSPEINHGWYEYSSQRRQRFMDELMRFEELAKLDKRFVASTLDVIGRGLNGVMFSIGGRNSSWSSERKRMEVKELPEFFSLMTYRALLGTDPKGS